MLSSPRRPRADTIEIIVYILLVILLAIGSLAMLHWQHTSGFYDRLQSGPRR